MQHASCGLVFCGMLLLCNAAWSITFLNKSLQVNDIRLVKPNLALTARHFKAQKRRAFVHKATSNTHKHDSRASIFNLACTSVCACGACVTSFIATLFIFARWKLIWPQLAIVAAESFVLTPTLRLNYEAYSLATLTYKWLPWIGDDWDFGYNGQRLPYFVQLFSCHRCYFFYLYISDRVCFYVANAVIQLF